MTTDTPVGGLVGIAPLAPIISARDLKAHCEPRSISELCLPVALTGDEMKQFDALVRRTRLKKHDALYRNGEAFHSLYAIQFGSLKTAMLAADGREQVTGYHILGEIIGFDGIGTNRYRNVAIALEDTEVCALPFTSVESLARIMPVLQSNLHRMMSTEIARRDNAMLLLGGMRADQRLAIFLINLADRYGDRGYSSTEYVMRLTREEIGSSLGVSLETVSRLFSQFHREGVISVQGRSVKLINTVRLKEIAEQIID